jgi:hypothetical protein
MDVIEGQNVQIYAAKRWKLLKIVDRSQTNSFGPNRQMSVQICPFAVNPPCVTIAPLGRPN